MYVYQPAGFLKRGTAAFIDAALLFTLTQLVSYLLYGHILIPLSDFINMFFPLYFIFIPAVWNGFTLGKRAVRIRISSVYRDGAGIGSMLLRYFGAVLFAFIHLALELLSVPLWQPCVKINAPSMTLSPEPTSPPTCQKNPQGNTL
ncbi:RDD family protein [Salibacterium aidingense]|uniref:RDD family protein n=1 Tax=Salibacterium aidingense TaxID=384933 RepID=UPI0004252DD8|nr:RDD family protein [Salibacterium aidingense]